MTDLDALATALAARAATRLAEADEALAARPSLGAAHGRQPVHTVYVPADRVHAGVVDEWGAAARECLTTHCDGPDDLAGLMDVDPALAAEVWPLVLAKLEREPVEDLRVDFEDGFTQRGVADRDADEDATIARVLDAWPTTPFSGFRFKALEAATRERGLRTLTLLLAGLGGRAGLRPTLPKVTSVAQVEALVSALTTLETELGLAPVPFEIQVETPQAILGPDGTALVSRMIAAARGRCLALHYGTYDYSASLGIGAREQSMEHPAADHAKAVMQVAVAGTGVQLSDGSTNRLPVGDREQVRAGWALHARLVTRSLRRGYAQGWDLHPHQLPTRFAATFAYFRTGLDETITRLRAWVEGDTSVWLDEPATAKAIAGVLVRGRQCGAVTEEESARVGLSTEELETLALTGRLTSA